MARAIHYALSSSFGASKYTVTLPGYKYSELERKYAVGSVSSVASVQLRVDIGT